MAACGVSTNYEEDDELLTQHRVDLSFFNPGSNHMPVEENLDDLVIVGMSRPLCGAKENDGKQSRVNTEYINIDIGKIPLNFDSDEEDHHEDEKVGELERMPTTVFGTVTTPKTKKKSIESLPVIDEQKIIEAAHRLEKVGAIPPQDDLPMDGRGRRQTVVTTATGKVISKKLATADELEGCIIAHLFFTTMRGNFPPLIITVPKKWPFIKMMRKGLAGMQRTIKKGERPSHDWIYNYHVNKEVKKMRKNLKILFGDQKVEFRGSNLNKKIETAALEPFVNRFWILPLKAEKNKYYRGRS